MITDALTHPATWITIIALDAVCWLYAFRLVRKMRQRSPDHGQTAWLVVIGNALVLIAYTIVLAVTLGQAEAIEWAALLLLLFAVAGIPMIFEYVGDHIDRLTRARQVFTDIQTLILGGARNDPK